ncbi:energy-coupling factor ABC transporter permease [Aquabacterium sp. OR-4]|uniref:energy-coupling factor ABC transporter permease n=1 Tax=Aquabacterium sp. OR-4 TaxID=2978127 RepID=UPI0021B18760|nr:energy-coupling factor ABC transporter permease [Aquabacterium sp. OR-4]MDT7836127.1 energy-coupling factor ABC transporter permease [Aquabacterium sp. OR-4]
MHIEPGLVDPGKLWLSLATGSAALAGAATLMWQTVQREGLAGPLLRTLLGTAAVLAFFELLWHQPVGVSELHLIMGSSLLLLLGAAPAALGLALGLLLQGLLFAPADLPQYGMNVTTLLLPLLATAALARRIIPAGTAYVDIGYGQALRLSLAFQGGIVAWVGFWALYGGGLGAENLAQIGRFGAAYLGVALLEPLVDLGLLALARTAQRLPHAGLLEPRVYRAS